MNKKFKGRFETQSHEITVEELGTIPQWLVGSLIRNTPAQYEIGKRSHIPMDATTTGDRPRLKLGIYKLVVQAAIVPIQSIQHTLAFYDVCTSNR